MKGEALTAYGVQRKEAQQEVSSPRDGNTASTGPDWYANSGEGWQGPEETGDELNAAPLARNRKTI